MALFGVCLFAATVSFSVSLMEIGWGITLFSVVFFVVASQTWRQTFGKLRADPLLLPWITYLGAGLISAVFGISPTVSFVHWRSDLIKALFYFTIFLVTFGHGKAKIRLWYFMGALAASFYGISQALFLYHASGQWVRAHGTMNSITYAETLTLALCFGLDAISKAESSGKRVLFASGSVVILAALLLSGARGPLLGFVAALACFVFCSRNRHLFAITAMLALLLVAAVCKYNHGILGRFSGVALSVRVATGTTRIEGSPTFNYTDALMGDRAELGRVGWQIARDYPLFGVGIANIKRMFSYYHPAPMLDDRGAKTVFNYSNVHNLYLQQLAERGALGLFALIFLLLSMTAVAWREYQQTRSLWLLCAVTAFFFINISETSFQHAVVAGAFILPFALRKGGGEKLRLRWPLIISAVLVSAVLLSLLTARPTDKSRPLDFDGPFVFWDQPAPASVNDLSRRAPPIVVQGAVGEFQFESNGANGLRAVSLNSGINDRRELQIGYCAGANSFSMALAPGNAVVLVAETIFSGKGKAWLFIQDERGGWQRDSIALSAGRTRGFVSRVIRDGARNVCLGVYWTPSADNEQLELLDVLISEKAPVLSGSVPTATP